ncbi:MAG: hypothetical protein LBQ88_09870 [Treponema sp.]|jgi:hypothetical protein|nr:hypothetical protein [Treponema sp.]
MIRVEIIANRSVEENILEALKDGGVGKYYTKYPNVFGVGTSGPRMGDAIWPEENFALVFWCDYEEALGIESAVAYVKEHFPDEGIKLFGVPEHESALKTGPVQTGASQETAAKSPVKEPLISRYNLFQPEIRSGYAASERFAVHDTRGTAEDMPETQIERYDSFTEKTARQDTFEERAEGSSRSDPAAAGTAERSEPAAIPKDVDNWLDHQNAVEEEPPHVQSFGLDQYGLEQEVIPAARDAAPAETGYSGRDYSQPEGWPAPSAHQPSQSPETERAPVSPNNGNAGMEDENF